MFSTINRTSTNILILFLCIVGFGLYKVNILISHTPTTDYERITWLSATITLLISAAVSIIIMLAIFTLLWSLTEKEHTLSNWRTFIRHLSNSILILIINELIKVIYAILLLDTELSSYGIINIQTLQNIIPYSTWYKITEVSDFIFLLISAGICCYQLLKYRNLTLYKALPYYMLSLALVITIKFFV